MDTLTVGLRVGAVSPAGWKEAPQGGLLRVLFLASAVARGQAWAYADRSGVSGPMLHVGGQEQHWITLTSGPDNSVWVHMTQGWRSAKPTQVWWMQTSIRVVVLACLGRN